MLPGTDNLRFFLREATSSAHDGLDGAMREEAGWETRSGYARFLAIQYRARLSVEEWLVHHAPSGLLPPPQFPLIAKDLAALDEVLPESPTIFAFDDTSPAAALGIAWAVAGSSLGNRAILKDIRRSQSSDGRWPDRFLADGAMQAFWSSLRRQIERPASGPEADAARLSAIALFNHFTNTVAAQASEQKALAS